MVFVKHWLLCLFLARYLKILHKCQSCFKLHATFFQFLILIYNNHFLCANHFACAHVGPSVDLNFALGVIVVTILNYVYFIFIDCTYTAQSNFNCCPFFIATVQLAEIVTNPTSQIPIQILRKCFVHGNKIWIKICISISNSSTFVSIIFGV